MEVIYGELRAMAGKKMAREQQGNTLQPTALVNEVFLKLSKKKDKSWKDRRHFMLTAGRSMRQVLVDHARGKNAAKRGADWDRVTLDIALDQLQQRELDLVALDDALTQLADQDARKARVVELRFFGGLAMPEIAEVLGISLRSAEGDWYMARAWLRKTLAA